MPICSAAPRFAAGGTSLTEPSSERILLAPPVALLVAASMPALYWFQERQYDYGLSLAFRPESLFTGGWWPGLVTSMFLHGGWAHVAMNAVGALAFGPPIARLLPGARGAAAFLAFYMVCGVIAVIGYALVHPTTQGPLVGASGAVFGLIGGALRLLGRRDGRIRPLRDPRFLKTAGVLMALNAVTGLIGLAPGMEGAQIAWEAHAFGFVAGALLLGPWVRLFGPRASAFDSPSDLRDPSA